MTGTLFIKKIIIIKKPMNAAGETVNNGNQPPLQHGWQVIDIMEILVYIMFMISQ